MHALGTAISTSLLPAGVAPGKDMGTVASWDFANQLWFDYDIAAKTGDVVRTRCAWRNPGNSAAVFGPNTDQEMCYSFTAYYPKITGDLGWAFPAMSALCKSL
jgi:hypothetical protein